MAEVSRLPKPVAESWDWQQRAACAGFGTERFFHPEGERGPGRAAREAAAKAVCAQCPVMADCARHALAVREPYGVWGGLSEDDRDAILARARKSVRAS